MKKLIAIMMTVCVVTGLFGVMVPADEVTASGTCGSNITWTLASDGVLAISGTGSMYSYDLEGIGPWYDYNASIKSIVIENGVSNIGPAAFGSLSNVTDVTIPDSVAVIGNYAFDSCTSLTAVTIPEGVEKIGVESFFGCSGLTSVTIPKSLTFIGNTAFGGCSSLSDVYYNGTEEEWNEIDFNYTSPGNPLFTATIHFIDDPDEDSEGELIYNEEDGKFYYYTDGEIDYEKYGFVSYKGGSFVVANGKVATEVNGLFQDPEDEASWYYCAGGQVVDYTGLAIYNEEWFYVENGKLNTTLAGFVEYNGSLFYVGAGMIQRGAQGLCMDPNNSLVWYYLADGQVVDYTGLALYDEHWFYVIKGRFATEFSGEVEYDGSTFNIVNGEFIKPSGKF